MSKNSIYTFNYFQPEEYRFSLDSVFLAQLVAKKYQEAALNQTQMESLRILDLCSGCGVIGLELSIHLPKLEFIDFLEVQEIYKDYFNKNVEGIHSSPKTNFRFLNENYEILKTDKYKNYYDLIVCNPPYFFKGEGLLSPSDFKNRCRFFLDSDFKSLIDSIGNSLTLNGEAFILARPGSHHGRNILEMINEIISENFLAEVFENVRGTDVIRIVKKF